MISHTFKEFIIPCCDKNNCLGNLLFIHGYCVDHTYFCAAKKLANYFNIYMIDLPGHGINTENIQPKDLTFENMTKHIVDYVNYKKLNDFILVGHSMGGGLSSWVANIIPSKIKKLILISPYNMAIFWIIKYCGLRAFRIFYPKNMKQKYQLLNILYKDYTKYLADKNWIEMNEKQLNWQLNNWKNMKKLGKLISGLPNVLKTRKMQKNINIDTLLLVGKYDQAISGYHTMKNFGKYFQNKKIEMFMFENSGHLCFEEEPDLFIEKIIEFVKK